MRAIKTKFTSTFTNRHGDQWRFEYDYHTQKAVLCGSDVDWQNYRVEQGRAEGLLLNDKELRWLRAAWREAVKRGRS